MKSFNDKKILARMAMTLLLAMTTSIRMWAGVGDEFTVGKLTYSVTNDPNSVYVKASGQSITGDLIIPESVSNGGKDYAVTGIADNAFNQYKSIKYVYIPASVTRIGNSAFEGCENLELLDIADGSYLTSIGERAFRDCMWLSSIIIPASVKSIGNQAFFFCIQLKSVIILAPSLTTYGQRVFHQLEDDDQSDASPILEDVKIYVFSENLGTYKSGWNDYRNRISAIDENTELKMMKGNVTYKFNDLSQKTLDFAKCNNKYAGDIVIAANVYGYDVTRISSQAFQVCSDLTSVTIPGSVTTIGDKAFYGCTGLTSVDIPNGVTSIGQEAFNNCEKLTSVTISDGVTSIGQQAFGYCTSLTSITIPASVTTIGDKAFEHCSDLTSATILGDVTALPLGIFEQCSSLTSFTIPASVTTIGNKAFEYCKSLKSVDIPNGVTTIGENAFYYCSGLTSVTIPSGVTMIGGSAFYCCRQVTDVYCYANPTNLTWVKPSTEFMLDKATKCHVKYDQLSDYQQIFGKGKYANVTFVGDLAEPGYAVIICPPGMSTYYNDRDLSLNDEENGSKLTFYRVTAVGPSSVTLTEITKKKIPANTPVIVENSGDSEIPVRMKVVSGLAAVSYAKKFKGTVNDKTLEFDSNKAYYGFNGQDFIIMREGGKVNAHRCWLEVTASGQSAAPVVAVTGMSASQILYTLSFTDGWKNHLDEDLFDVYYTIPNEGTMYLTYTILEGRPWQKVPDGTDITMKIVPIEGYVVNSVTTTAYLNTDQMKGRTRGDSNPQLRVDIPVTDQGNNVYTFPMIANVEVSVTYRKENENPMANIAGVVALSKAILNGSTDPEFDINGDNKVDAKDIVDLVNIIAGK